MITLTGLGGESGRGKAEKVKAPLRKGMLCQFCGEGDWQTPVISSYFSNEWPAAS